VNTDHGFLLGEHDYWAKCSMPFYNEIANMPLFIWDPRSKQRGEHRQSLAQTIDLPATLLEYFDVPLPRDMAGRPLRETIATDAMTREAGLYGMHGAQVNVTDGRWVYMRAPAGENAPLFNYTVMPTHMRRPFTVEEMQTATLAEPMPFTKGSPTLRIDASGPAHGRIQGEVGQTLLFDLDNDPEQMHPVEDAEVERRMLGHLDRLMMENDAPTEQWERLGL